MRFRKASYVVAASALAAVWLPSVSAYAAGQATVSYVNGVITYESAPGLNDDLMVIRYSSSANYVNFYGANLVAGPGCAADPSLGLVACLAPDPVPVVINLGDGNDKVYVRVPATVNAGPGNDLLDGGPGGPQSFNGGEGDDVIAPDGPPNFCPSGTTQVGPDDVVGGPGNDYIDYRRVTAGTSVTLDDVANDGIAGEGDNVHSDVENAILSQCPGPGANVYVGSAAANLVQGSGTIDVGAGDDVVWGYSGDDVIKGGPGNDKLQGGDGNDTITGGDGDDFLEGGFDDDDLDGGAGTDSYVGDTTVWNTNGSGNDTIHASDGVKENVNCGPGADVANVDALDNVGLDPMNGCETINRSQLPGPTGPDDPPGSGALSAGTAKLVAKKKQLSVKLTCRLTDTAGCNGKVTLQAAKTKKAKQQTLAGKTISIASGKSQTLKFKLSAGELRLLKSKKAVAYLVGALRTSTGTTKAKVKLKVKR